MSLVAHAIRLGSAFLQAQGCSGRILVDTDGDEIAAEAAECGHPVPFRRRPELGSDDSLTIDTTIDALDRLEERGERFDVVLLLQPTSPLRSLNDALRCFSAHLASGSALTVCPPAHPPQRALLLGEEQTLSPLWPGANTEAPRQHITASVEANGAVYVNTVDFLRNHRKFFVAGHTRGVLMTRERSIDIDEEFDLKLCDALMTERDRKAEAIQLGERLIGPGQPCCFVHSGPTPLAPTEARTLINAKSGEEFIVSPGSNSTRLANVLRGERVTNQDVVAQAAKQKLPLFMVADGVSAFAIARAVDIAASQSNRQVAVLSRHLSRMRSGLGVPFGLICEPAHAATAVAAVARGASIVSLGGAPSACDEVVHAVRSVEEKL